MNLESFDLAAALHGLKDFQRRTVDYAFQRMYLDAQPTSRFLIADEVGLGKTLVARGIISKAVDHLRRTSDRRIDVLYVCSNASIAQQNLNKLNVTNERTASFATRLTLLPLELKHFKNRPINFISFTPGTTFDLKGRGGRVDERALIFRMLEGRLGIRAAQLSRLLQGSASTGWKWWARKADLDFDPDLAKTYVASLLADEALMGQLSDVCQHYHRVKRSNAKLRGHRLHLIGELRRRLADVCVDALEPDLVVMDEFQRFKDLLQNQEDDDAAELAQRLFTHPEVRILLLSATPYRMLAMDDEGSDDHYGDFLETIRFLFSGDEVKLQAVSDGFRRFRQALYGVAPDARADAIAARRTLESLLGSVIARTERIDMTQSRNAMLVEKQERVPLRAQDLHAASFIDRVSNSVEGGSTIEYWKSSPYLIHFMKDYALKTRLQEACAAGNERLCKAVRGANGQLLRNLHVQRYEPIDANSPRLRALMRDTVETGQWRWLWLPPALPYLKPSGAYAGTGAATKSLVFSSWQVVPDAIAALLSYEAERLMLEGTGELPKYRRLREERGPLLQLRLAPQDRRPSGMPALALLYPCATLAAVVDPLALALEVGGSEAADVGQVRRIARERVSAKLATLRTTALAGRVDERWYWAAPVLLDRTFAEEVLSWIDDESDHGFLAALAQDEDEASHALREHVTLWRDVAHGRVELDRQPDDLVDVLVDQALGGFANCAIRSMQRVAHDLPETSAAMLNSAVKVSLGLRAQFNQPEVTAMLRADDEKTAYWRRVLQYCIDGNLQAVLDEYAHFLREGEGLGQRPGHEVAEGVAKTMAAALSLRPSSLKVEDFKATSNGRVRVKDFSMRCRFALRFGDIRGDDGKMLVRAGNVRQAFNSPFRPFVLASTSIGQEGLDFHPYCHVVYHWNLPGNPVDLEQREGRVHRYKGHAIRRNVAAAYGLGALNGKGWSDPWEELFSRAVADRPASANELTPYWLFERSGGHAVERRVPMLPMSREVSQFQRLKRMLAVYRLAFGQPRQEELLTKLLNDRGSMLADDDELRLRLAPPNPASLPTTH